MNTSKITKPFFKTVAVCFMAVLVFFSSFPLTAFLQSGSGKIIDKLYLSRLGKNVIDNFGAKSAEAATASSTLQYMLNIGPVSATTASSRNHIGFLNPSGSGKTAVVKKIRLKSDSVSGANWHNISLRRIAASSGGTQITTANIPKKNTNSSDSIMEVRYSGPVLTFAQASTTEARMLAIVSAGAAGSVDSRSEQDFGTDENIILQPGEGLGLLSETAGDVDQRISMYVEWEEQTSAPTSQGEYMLNYPRIAVAAGTGYVFGTFFNPAASGKTAVLKRISIDVSCNGTAVYTNNISIRRITDASGGTAISAANIPKKHTGTGNSIIEARYTNPSAVYTVASTTEARMLMVTPCAAANAAFAHRNLRFANGDEKLIIQPGEGLAMLSEAAGDVNQLVRWGVEWQETASTPSAANEYMMNYPRVELAAAAGGKFHTFLNPSGSGKTAVIRRLGIYVDADSTATSQPISVRRISAASGGTAQISAANIPKKHTSTPNSVMQLRYKNVTATLSGGGTDARITSLIGPGAAAQAMRSQKEIVFATRGDLILKEGEGIALYSELAGDIDQYVKFFVEWQEVANVDAPTTVNEYLTSVGMNSGVTNSDYVYSAFYNPPTSGTTTLIKRVHIRVDSAAVATSLPFSLMRISTSSGGTLVTDSDIPKKNTSSGNSVMEIRKTGVTVTYTGSTERLIGVSAPSTISAVVGPALSGRAERIYTYNSSSTQESLVLKPGEGIALRQEGAGFTGHRVFLEVEWQEVPNASAPAAANEFVFSTPEIKGAPSPAVNYVYGTLYNPADSGKNYIVHRLESRIHSTTTAVYVSASFRRISTSSNSTLITASNIGKKNTSGSDSTAQIRHSGTTVLFSGATTSRLSSVITPGTVNQANGHEQTTINIGDELVLKPGEGIAFYQEAIGDVDQKYFFQVEWREDSISASITIAGTVYDTNESSDLGSGYALKLAVDGATSYNATTTSGGAFSFSVSSVSAGNILTIWLSTTTKGTLVLKYGSSCSGYSNCTGLSVVKNQVRLENKHTGNLTESDTSACNSTAGAACTDADIGFSNGSQLSVDADRILKIVSGTTYAPTVPVVANGSLYIGGTYSPAATTTVAVDFTNAGTFTHNNKTVIFSSSSTSTLSSIATTTFYNLTVTTPNKEIRFQKHTANVPAFTIANTFTVTGTAGNPVLINSDTVGSQWLVNFSGAQSAITYASIKDSGCYPGSATATLNGDTVINRGNNGSCWSFAVTINISGTVYGTNETSPLLEALSMKLAVGASTSYLATASAVDGTFTFSGVAQPTNGTVLTIWLNTTLATSSSLVFKYGTSCNGGTGNDCTGLALYQNRVSIDNKYTGNMAISDLVACDNDTGSVCADADIGFIATTTPSASSTLSWLVNILKIVGGATFAPGGNLTAQKISVAGTYTGGSETLTLSGGGISSTCTDASQTALCVVNPGGIFTPTSNTVTYSTSTSFSILSTTYNNLNIQPVAVGGPNVTLLSGSLTVNGNLVLGDGTNAVFVTASTSNPTIIVTGNFTNSTSSTFTATTTNISVGGNFTNTGTFAHGGGTVTMTATSGTKTISGNISFYDLAISGSGGAFDVTSATTTVVNNLIMTAGTLQGTGPITVQGGTVSGNGTINLTGGTFTLGGVGNFGGNTAWIFSNLTFGATASTTAIGTTTVTGILTNSGTLDAGAKTWTLSGSGTPFVQSGTFYPSTSTFNYTGTSNVTVANSTYYNLSLAPAGTPTYTIAEGVTSGWYSTGGTWTYRKPIIINHNKIASSTGETYANFPVLLHVAGDADLKYTGSGGNVASSTGGDILITSSDGTTKLNYEIEEYSSSTGETLAWVKVPSLSTSTDTTLYLYYGNASAPYNATTTGVWGINYKGVWHLGETVTNETTGGTHYDSTLMANNATQYNNVNSVGKIGVGQYLDGTGDYLRINSDSSNWLSMTEGTLSLWYKSDGTPNASGLFDFEGVEDYLDLYIYFGPMRLIHRSDYGTEYYIEKTIDDVTTDTNWHNIVATWKVGGSPYTLSLVYDGTQVTNTDSIATPVAFSGTTYIGIVSGSSYPFKGTLDELKISNNARSLDWIKTEYNNQNSTTTFYSVGTQETNSGGGLFTVNNNLTVGNGANAVPVVAPASGININGSVNISSGTLNLNTNNASTTIVGNLTFAGTLSAPASASFVLQGNFTNNGTFTHNNGTVTITPVATSTIAGSAATNFYNLTSNAPFKELRFKNGQQLGVAGLLTLSGWESAPLDITSDSFGVQWLLNLTGTANYNYIRIRDSGCSAGSVNQTEKVTDRGNNSGACWGLIIRGGGGGGLPPRDGSTGGGSQQDGGGEDGDITPVDDGGGGGGGQQDGGGAGGGGGAAP